MLKDTPAFTMHGALTLNAPYVDGVLYRPNPKVIGGMEAYVPQIGEDQEVCQFAVEFPTKPLKESHLRAACKQMEEALVERARRAGLVIS